MLTLQNADGIDVTAQGTFFANGEELQSNRFSTTTGSLAPVQITAKYNGLDVDGSVAVTASSSYSFTNRVLLEDITKTGCQYCPIVIRLIEELRQDAQQLVVPLSVHNSNSSIYSAYYTQTTRQFADKFCEYFGLDKSAAPKVFINRNKNVANHDTLTADELRAQAVNGPKDVAIALESSVEGTTIPVKVTIGSKKDFSGKVVVVLVENGIEAYQQNMGNIEMYRMMRAYAPSVEGESKSFKTNSPVSYTTTFDAKNLALVNTANCEVIAFVTDDADGLCENAQFAKIGEVKGY